MNQHHINEYQDTYRQAWELQNKIDAKINKMVFDPDQRSAHAIQGPQVANKNGSLGGRPKTGRNAKLTENAKVVNNMLKYNLTTASIAGMLELTEKSVEGIINRYGLPRDV